MDVDEALGVRAGQRGQVRGLVHSSILGRVADIGAVSPRVHAALLCHSRNVEFTAQTAERDGCSVVTAVGELDAHAAPALEAEISPLTGVAGGRLVVDLTEVPFVDSTGLSVLVTALKGVRDAGGRLDVVVTAPRVLKVLAITGLDAVIPVHGSIEEALAPLPEA